MNQPGTPLCDQCGYNLHGLDQYASCPECGLTIVATRISKRRRDSYVRRVLILNCAGYLIYFFTAPFAALGMYGDQEIYGIYTWPLILGWLSGALFLLGSTFYAAQIFNLIRSRQLLLNILLLLLWIAALSSAFVLFKTAGRHGFVNRWSSDPYVLGYGVALSPAIVVATVMPVILICIQKKRRVHTLLLAAALHILASGTLVGLFIVIWLDWTVGLDLHLRFPSGNTTTIKMALQWALVGCWIAAVTQILASVHYLTLSRSSRSDSA